MLPVIITQVTGKRPYCFSLNLHSFFKRKNFLRILYSNKIWQLLYAFYLTGNTFISTLRMFVQILWNIMWFQSLWLFVPYVLCKGRVTIIARVDHARVAISHVYMNIVMQMLMYLLLRAFIKVAFPYNAILGSGHIISKANLMLNCSQNKQVSTPCSNYSKTNALKLHLK